MLQLLETGQALYVLAGICILGILTRAMTKHLYKRLWKETTNLTTTKNKRLQKLRQKAENTYRANQGMRDSGAWLENQLFEMKAFGISLPAWSNLCMQWTWLCLLAGGVGAFLSYWLRLDSYYIVLYGGGSVLLAMVTMLFDNGTNSGWRDQLQAGLQDQLENIVYPRLARSMAVEASRGGAGGNDRPGLRGTGARNGRFSRFGRDMRADAEMSVSVDHPSRDGLPRESLGREDASYPAGAGEKMENGGVISGSGISSSGISGSGISGGAVSGGIASGSSATSNGNPTAQNGGSASPGSRKLRGGRNQRNGGGASQGAAAHGASISSISGQARGGETGNETVRDVDYLKRSLEQIAASREKSRAADENWLRDLKPEEVELIGDILKQYLA